MRSVVLYVVIFGVLFALLALSARNRRRQFAAQQDQVARIGVGAQVMTTSGLYGTVVTRNDDGTVLLEIAPGVQVRWAGAALRDATALDSAYRRPLGKGTGFAGTGFGERPADPSAPGHDGPASAPETPPDPDETPPPPTPTG